MTGTYQAVFGGTVIYPADVSYRAVSLTANTELSWPTELATDTNVVSQIMNVTAAAGPFDLIMPAANLASVGQTTLIFNVGSNAFTVTDNLGNVIVSIAPGLAYQIFLTDNTTPAGTWSQVNYGAGTSSATAGSLAGLGIKALGTTLNQSMAVIQISLDYSFSVGTDRSQAFVWTGGAGTLTLPLAADAGNDWFVNLRNNGTGSITLVPAGSDLINGVNSVIFNPGDSATITCSGSSWYTFGFGQATEFAFDYASIDLSTASTPYVLAGANLNRISYNFSGAISSNFIIIVPTTTQQYWVTNNTSGGHAITIKTLAGTGITLQNGEASILYCNGTNVVDADTAGVALPITVTNGGTGAANATDARTNLSAAKSGLNADITQITALSDGGATSPAITFLSESNTGIYRSGSGALSVALSGSQTATFSTSGLNLASGDAYSIAGTSVLSATTLGSGVINSSLTSVGALTSGSLGPGFTTVAVARGGTGATSLTSGYLVKGNGTSAVSSSVVYDTGTIVGIGTTAPNGILSVVGDQISVGSAAGSGSLGIQIKGTTLSAIPAAQVQSYIATGSSSMGSAGDLLIAPRTDIAANIRFITGTTPAEQMRIDGSGNVGIGTSSPSRTLSVYSASSIPAQIESSGTDARISIVTSSGSGGQGFIQASSGALLLGSSNTERARIDSSGNVGIGATSPAAKLDVNGTVKFSGALTSGDLADAVGYKGLPQNARTSSYTLALSDMGKHVSITTGGVVIPANASVAFPVGAAISIYNDSSSSQTISITSDTLYLAGTATTGSRTLAQRGFATVVKVNSTTWIISGAGVS